MRSGNTPVLASFSYARQQPIHFPYGSVGIVADIVISFDIELGQIAFGIDLNASTGPSLLGYDKVPGLCHEDGKTYTWQ